MKVRKTVVVAAAIGALTALGASSAMAMEHIFSGSFKMQFDASNFNGSTTPNSDGVYDPFGKPEKAPSADFVDSRARIGYTAKLNNDLKFVSIFELDYSFWGNNSYSEGRNNGGALGADSVQIETKNLYVDYNINERNNVKFGMQGFDDAFKGVFVSSDMAGILLSHTYSNAVASAGVFRWDDTDDGDTLGQDTRDFFVLDGKYNITKETKVGAAYYYLHDNSSIPNSYGDSLDAKIHTLGLNGETVLGPVTLDGFVLTQFGDYTDNVDISAYAANLGARMKAGKGTLRGEFLYSSGDKDPQDDKYKAMYTAYGNGGYESGYYNDEMVLLTRDKNALTIDNAIVYDTGNQGHGVILLAAGYDLPLSDKLSCSGNLGVAWNAEKQELAPGVKEKHDFLGTEINAELNYKINDNFMVGARAAYVFLGNYFDDASTKDGIPNSGDPDNPYDVKLIARYSF
jgi:hypothetical protein